MKKITFVGIMLLPLLLAVLNGCASEEVIEPDYPFEVQYVLGKEHILGFNGNAAGHVPGESSEFVVTLINNGTDVWNDRYLIQLVDEISVVTTLHEASISVGPGASEIFPINITFSSNLERKAYGLAVFIPGRMAAITNIFVGIPYYPLPFDTKWASPAIP